MKPYFLFLALILVACSTPEEQNSEPQTKTVKEIQSDDLQVALLIMDGTYNTELTAPMDIFHHTNFRDSIQAMAVFTIAESMDDVITFEGLKISPDFDFSNHPEIDILVIPAAEGHLGADLQNEKLIQFIKDVEPNADYVMSHCDGAFLLAKTGLLDDRKSTTFPGDIEEYQEMYPNLDVAEEVLFVHDGKYITSAGGAKSFEASLYLCELLYGKKVADQLAKGMVIDWDLNSIDYIKVD